MRGKLLADSDEDIRKGITPAHAGKTHVKIFAVRSDRDHPRACGENTPLGGNMITMPGSPPRMRGKRYALSFASMITGITPAHAGKTCSACARLLAHWDHPRACGEN